MTYKEYIDTFDKKRIELEGQQQRARMKCLDELNEKFKDIIGKKVRYSGRNEVVYFGGFDFGYSNTIQPLFFKIKKDGTQSKQSAGIYAYHMENDDIISKLEIVNK